MISSTIYIFRVTALMLLFFSFSLQPTHAQEAGSECQPITVENAHLITAQQVIDYPGVLDYLWSPDGQMLIVQDMSGLHVFDPQTFVNVATITTEHTRILRSPILSSDGQFLAWIGFDALYIWNAETQTTQQTPFTSDSDRVTDIAISPDDTKLYEFTETGIGQPNQLRVRDIGTGEVLQQVDNNDDIGHYLLYNSFKNQLISIGVQSIIVRDADTLEETAIHEFRFPDQIFKAELSPDGSVITILWFTGNSPFDFYITSYSTEDLTELGGYESFEDGKSIQYSPDGALFAYSEGSQVLLESLEDDQVVDVPRSIVALLSGHRSEPTDIEFSPDMRHIITTSRFIGVEQPADADKGTAIIWGVCS